MEADIELALNFLLMHFGLTILILVKRKKLQMVVIE